MEAKSLTIYLARPSRIIMVLATLLTGVAIAQILIYDTAREVLPFPGRGTRSARPARTKTRPSPTEDQKRRERLLNADKVFLPDGTIHLLVPVPTRSRLRPCLFYPNPSPVKQVEVYDVDHKLLWSGQRKDLPYRYVSWSEPAFTSLTSSDLEFSEMLGFEFSQSLTVPVTSPDGTAIERWDYQPHRERFVGYDPENRRIGYAGAKGFTDSWGPNASLGGFEFVTAWHPRDGVGPSLLWKTSDTLYQINFATHSVQKLFQARTGQRFLVGMKNWRELRDERPGYRPLIYSVDEDGKFNVLLREPDQQLTFSVPKDWRFGHVSLTATKEKIFLRYEGMEWGAREGKLPEWGRWTWSRECRSVPGRHWVEMYEIGSAGELTLVSRYEWTRPPKPPRATKRREVLHPAEKLEPFLMGFSSPVYAWAWDWRYEALEDAQRYRWERPSWTLADEVIYEFLRVFRPTRIKLNLALSLLMVGVVLWHGWARRTSWAKFAFWLVFVGLFNLAGLLTYSALNHTPVIRCAVCGKKRSLRIPTCRACKAELTPPAPRDVDLVLTASSS